MGMYVYVMEAGLYWGIVESTGGRGGAIGDYKNLGLHGCKAPSTDRIRHRGTEYPLWKECVMHVHACPHGNQHLHPAFVHEGYLSLDFTEALTAVSLRDQCDSTEIAV